MLAEEADALRSGRARSSGRSCMISAGIGICLPGAAVGAKPYLIRAEGHRLAQSKFRVVERDRVGKTTFVFEAPRSRDYFLSVFSHSRHFNRASCFRRALDLNPCGAASPTGLGFRCSAMRPVFLPMKNL